MELVNKQARLERELLMANVKLQKLHLVEDENFQLRELVNCKKKTETRYLVAELLNLALDNFDHRITINRGKNDGVYVGQPVLDSRGVVGQVILVEDDFSRIMPITAKKSAIPVVAVKSGLQTIALGTGSNDLLELTGVTVTSEIKPGDLLVTSGIGGVFPAGYVVGTVKKIETKSGERFLKVWVTPSVKVGGSLYLLLPWETSKK